MMNLPRGFCKSHDILKIKGVKGVPSDLSASGGSKVYRFQEVDNDDKHIEIIIRRMLRKVRVEDAGDTDMLSSGLVDIFKFEKENQKIMEQEEQPAVAKRVLLGITKELRLLLIRSCQPLHSGNPPGTLPMLQ